MYRRNRKVKPVEFLARDPRVRGMKMQVGDVGHDTISADVAINGHTHAVPPDSRRSRPA